MGIINRFPLLVSLFFLLVLVPMNAQASQAQATPDEITPQWEKVDPVLQQTLSELDEEATVEFVLRLTAGADLENVEFQRQEVVNRLQAAASSQAHLVPLLKEMSFEVKNSFWITNAILVEGPAGGVPALTTSPLVTRLHRNFEISLPEARPTSLDAVEVASVTWGLERVEADSVWSDLGVRGTDVRVCVSDTGADVSHPDLAGKMWSDVPGDPAYPGGWIEFGSSGNPVAGSTPHDTHGHGTHTSGTILGGEVSGTAIGMAPEATLMHALVLPGGAGSFAQVIAGIEWCVSPYGVNGMPAGQPAKIHSMSWGASGFANALIDPIRNSYLAGTLPVAAAGNCGEDCTNSPGNIYDALSVGASDEDDSIASFSSGGVVRKSSWASAPGDWPDEWVVPLISAPGVNIYSSLPGGGYDYWSGTSMATPHVTGCAALMASSNLDLTPEDLRLALVETAVWYNVYTPSPPDTRYGWGRMNCHAAALSVADNGGIRGSVRDALDGAPVPETSLNVTGSALQRILKTDELGAFRISLQPGTYNLTVGRFGYLSQTVTDITLTQESWVELDLLLSPFPRSNITGAAFSSSSGIGIPGVTVEVKAVPVTLRAGTGGNGAFVLEKIPEGVYDLAATSPYFEESQISGVLVVSGTNSTVSFAMDPRKWVAVMGDEGNTLSTILQDLYYVENPSWDDIIDDTCRYDAVVVNHPSSPGGARFNEFLAATDGAGTGVVFLDTYRHTFGGGGIFYLRSYRSDPQQRSYGFDTAASYTFYNVTQSHPVLGTRAPGDLIVLESATYKHGYAWFDLFAGEAGTTIAHAGTDRLGELGPGIAVDERANNRHVLLSLHGASSEVDPTDWTGAATEVFVNAVDWSARSSCPDARIVDFQLDVTPEIGLWHEAFQAKIQAKNVGAVSGNYTARLYVNDALDSVQSLGLAPGEAGVLTFGISRDAVGPYSVVIGPHESVLRIRPPTVDVHVLDVDGTILSDASVTVGRGTAVLEMGRTDGNGSVTFDSPGGSHGQYWIVVAARDLPPDGNHYFLSKEVLVEDDLVVKFEPAENETARLELRMETAAEGQTGRVHIRHSAMPQVFSYAFAFTPGRIMVDAASYSLWSEVTWTSPGSTWTYGTTNVTKNITAVSSAQYEFGGRLKAWMAWNQSAENVTADWNVSDAYGNGLLALKQVRAGILEAGETTFHDPFLSFWNADGGVLTSGYVAWSQRSASVTLSANETAALVQVDLDSGSYPFDNTFELDLTVFDGEGTELSLIDVTRATRVQFTGTVLLSGTPVPVNLTVNDQDVATHPDGSFSHILNLSEGLNSFVVHAIDPAGNSREHVYVIESKPILALVVVPLPAYVNLTSVQVSGVVEQRARLTINGVVVNQDEDGSFQIAWQLSEGPNTIVVAAEDYLGNKREVRYEVIRDTLPPEIAVLAPISGQSTQDPAVSFIGKTEENATLTINGVLIPMEAGSFVYEAPLIAGDNTFHLESRDLAGNLGHVIVSVYRAPALFGVPLTYLAYPLPVILIVAIAWAYRRHRRRRSGQWSSYPRQTVMEPPAEGTEEDTVPWLHR